MPATRGPVDLACLVVAHNLGDAVIQSDFYRSLIDRGYARRYVVWTRPQTAFLFDGLPNSRVVCSQFPIGTNKQFGFRAFIQFCRSVLTLRGLRPGVTIDLIGDARDRWFGKLAGGRKHVHIGWTTDHPFSRLIRNPFGIGSPLVTVPSGVSNIYSAHRLLLDALAPADDAAPSPGAASKPRAPTGLRRIGLHPFASQACKLWPRESWRELVANLLDADSVEITAFGSPGERAELEALFISFADRIQLVTVDLPDFARRVAQLDLMIGLDSFSVHMAHRQGVRSILINGGNPRDLWATPTGDTLACSGGCRFYPCFNIPKCEGKSFEYICVKSVRVADVVDAIRRREDPGHG